MLGCCLSALLGILALGALASIPLIGPLLVVGLVLALPFLLLAGLLGGLVDGLVGLIDLAGDMIKGVGKTVRGLLPRRDSSLIRLDLSPPEKPPSRWNRLTRWVRKGR